jgi:peptidase E
MFRIAPAKAIAHLGDSRLPLYTRRVGGHVVAMGGLSEPILRFAVALTGSARPRVAVLPTAGGDDDWGIARMYELLTGYADVDAIRLFGVPERPCDRIARADAVVVPGGNTANMLAVWRVHGVDAALESAWRDGGVLVGWSAGANCWFECSVTDSFGPELAPLRDGLGLLPGSFCPHYDGEELRRPTYRALVDDGFPPGYAADDDAALHFVGTALSDVVSARAGATGYRVEPGAETPHAPRVL